MPGQQITLDTFNPSIASRQIADNCEEIQKRGEAIIEARNQLIIAEAAYMDAKNESRRKRMVEYNATMAKEWVEIDTCQQKKELQIAEHNLRNMIEFKDIIESVNNNLKIQIRLWEVEYKNIKYTQ